MNKLYRNISIFILIQAYCLVLFTGSGIGHSCEVQSHHKCSTNDLQYFSNLKVLIYCHLNDGKRLINSPNKLLNSFERKYFDDQVWSVGSQELLFIKTFTSYIINRRFQFKSFTSTDIIFPFHYFW